MPNCRSITDDQWNDMRKSLVFFFSRHHGFHQAEDLAQDTVAAMLRRTDFEFDQLEDFPRVCQAFANNIAREAHRRRAKLAATQGLDNLPARGFRPGLGPEDLSILLDQICEIGTRQIKDWQLVEVTATGEGNLEIVPTSDSSLRVRLHRARKRLAELTGWRRK